MLKEKTFSQTLEKRKDRWKIGRTEGELKDMGEGKDI